MNYMIYPNTSSFEELIKINKTLKANLIVYNADNHELFGFSQDYNDANVLKILEYNTYPTIDRKKTIEEMHQKLRVVQINRDGNLRAVTEIT